MRKKYENTNKVIVNGGLYKPLLDEIIEHYRCLDDEIYNDEYLKQSKPKRYIHKGWRTKTICTYLGAIKFKRRIYYDTLEKKYHYWLDEKYHLYNEDLQSKHVRNRVFIRDDAIELFIHNLITKNQPISEALASSNNSFSKSLAYKILKKTK